MAAFNFPDTTGQPTDGTFVYEIDGLTYVWDGEVWKASTGSAGGGGGGANVIVKAEPAPAAAELGDLWYNTTDGNLYVYDGTTWQPSSEGGASVTFAAPTPAVGSEGDFWYDTTNNKLYVSDGSAWQPSVTSVSVSANEFVFDADILPTTDNSFDIGSPTARVANLYTGDLHLANERGNWTMIEENEYLSLRNNKTGKTYKLVMEEVD